jgi:tripartite motif-containing protein 71
MGKARLFLAILPLAAAALGLSGCMQAINSNAGYKYFTYGNVVNTAYGTKTNHLYYPRGIALDSTGDVFIVDSGNDRIIKMPGGLTNTTSNWVTYPNGTYGAYPFYAPEGIAVVSSTDIWVADSGHGTIVHLTGWGSSSPNVVGYYSSVTKSGKTYAFSYPTGLAVSGNTLYVTDPGSDFPNSTPRIYEIDISSPPVSGTPLTGLNVVGNLGSGVDQFSYPRGIAVDPSGNVYVADETNYRIDKMNSSLSGWTTLGTRGSGTGQFISPQTVAVDSSGQIYVVDSGNYWVVKMTDISGSGWTLYGAQTGSASTSVYPNWVAVSSTGSSVYVSDDTMYQIAEFQ